MYSDYTTLDEQPVAEKISDSDSYIISKTDPSFKMWEENRLWFISSKFESATIVFKGKTEVEVIDKYNARVRNEDFDDSPPPTAYGMFPIEF